MDTKPCRLCRQPIAADARRCQHCQGDQSWWTNYRDPRYQIILMVVAFAVFGGFALFMQRSFEPGIDREAASPRLAVSDISSRIVSAADGPHVFVMGRVQNSSPADAAGVWFRVNVLDGSNRVIDSFLAESRGLVVPGNGSTTFRVVAQTSAAPAEVKRTEVTVDRAKARSRWD